MDLEGIEAIGAVGVAAISVIVTGWMGQRQTNAALQTARVAMVQSYATYRAALDVVGAQGHNQGDCNVR